MAKILRLKDTIKIKVGEVTYHLSPLSEGQKTELFQYYLSESGDSIVNYLKLSSAYMKFSLKKIEGVEDFNGKPYKVERDENGLTEECLAEIMGLNEQPHMNDLIVSSLSINRIPDKTPKGVKLEVIPMGNEE